jgi:small conductance mechanosensitive channel
MLKILLSKKVIEPIIIVAVLFTIYFFINRIIKKLMKSSTNIMRDSKKNKTILAVINNIVKYFLIFVGFVMILNVYNVNTSSLIASLGVASAVAALAFQDTLKDFLAGVFILIENQYDIGDTVTINGFKGEVVGLGLRMTRLRAFSGEYCFISNRNVGDVINHSLSKSLAVVNVEVAYEEDVEKVEEILTKLCERLTKELPDLSGVVTLDGIDDLGSSGVVFRITAETTPLKHYAIQRKLLREIKIEFDKKQIKIPYPQLEVHHE